MTSPLFVSASVLLLILGSTPVWASNAPEWVTEYDHIDSSPQTKGYFFRFDLNHANCVSSTFNVTYPRAASPTPSLVIKMIGEVRAIGGYEVERWGGWGSFIAGPPEEYGDTRFMLNDGLGDASIVHMDENSSYDEPHGWLGWHSRFTVCFAPTEAMAPASHYWIALIATGPVTDVSASLRFYESCVEFECVVGAAQGRIYHAADTESTFLRRMKDFNGTFAYDGDPLGLTGGANAAAANVETTINVDRGFVGGFHSYRGTSVLSYEGPGMQRLVEPASTVGVLGGPDARYIAGSPGEWKFNVHAYAAPDAYSQVFVYGMDIEPAKWVLPPPTQDNDRDMIADAAEPGICGLEDFNDPADGTCDAAYRDYRPPS